MKKGNQEQFSMLDECVNKYEVLDVNESETEISIQIPKRFRSLWLVKLTDLYTTEKEIEEYADE